MLTVEIGGESHVEVFRVSRAADQAPGRPPHESGVEFLPMPAGLPSLHDVAARLDERHEG